jgi:hypothetical protein
VLFDDLLALLHEARELFVDSVEAAFSLRERRLLQLGALTSFALGL